MAAEVVTRFIGEVSGLGNDKKVSARAALSDVPTHASGPLMAVVAVTAIIDLGATISGQLTGLYVKAHSGKFYVDPINSAINTVAACYLPEGQFNYFTYLQAGVSVVPTVVAVTAGSVLEYWYSVTS